LIDVLTCNFTIRSKYVKLAAFVYFAMASLIYDGCMCFDTKSEEWVINVASHKRVKTSFCWAVINFLALQFHMCHSKTMLEVSKLAIIKIKSHVRPHLCIPTANLTHTETL